MVEKYYSIITDSDLKVNDKGLELRIPYFYGPDKRFKITQTVIITKEENVLNFLREYKKSLITISDPKQSYYNVKSCGILITMSKITPKGNIIINLFTKFQHHTSLIDYTYIFGKKIHRKQIHKILSQIDKSVSLYYKGKLEELNEQVNSILSI